MPDPAQADGAQAETPEPISAIEALENLLTAAREQDTEARDAAWSHIQDPDVMDELAREWRTSSDRIYKKTWPGYLPWPRR